MCKVIRLLVLMLGVLPTASMAHDGIRVFDAQNADLSPETVQNLTGCAISDATMSTDCLGRSAYDTATSTGALSLVPLRNQDQASYIDLFVRWNGLGDTMTVSRFIRKATGTGFYLPQGEGRSAPLQSAEWSQIRGDIDLLQQQVATLTPGNPAVIAGLREQIITLENRLTGVDASTAGLLGTLHTLQAVIANVPNLLETELNAQKAEIDARLSAFTERLVQVEAAVSTKAEQTDLTALSSRVASLELANSSVMPNNLLSASVPTVSSRLAVVSWWIWGFVIFVLISLVWLVLKASQVKVTAQIDHTVAAVAGLNERVYNPVTGLLPRLTAVEADTKSLKGDLEYVIQIASDGLRIEGIPTQDTLETLDPGGHIDLKIAGADANSVVRVVRGTFTKHDGSVDQVLYVHGVKNQNNALALRAQDLSRCLFKALSERRVEGIHLHSGIGLQPKDYHKAVKPRALPRKTEAA